MSRRRGRVGPADPQDILARNAQARAAERAKAANPGEWGVSAEIHVLPTAAEVETVLDNRGRVLAAKRSDPYDLLHNRGNLSDEQHRASRRLFRDMALAAGVRDGPPWIHAEKIDFHGGDPGAPTQIMLDASKRAQFAMGGVGPANARLLKAINEPMIAGETRAWRGIVQRITGEKDQNAHGALVRQACENLVMVYRAIDDRVRAASTQGGPAGDLRPFGSFEVYRET